MPNRPLSLIPGCAAALMLLAFSAQAQQVYRHIGADGRVTYSDRAPTTVQNAGQPRAAAPAVPAAALPYVLQAPSSRYPVRLYTGEHCEPCSAARNYLNDRGIPYTELTVTTNEDIAALAQLGGGGSLPFISVGQQRLPGFAVEQLGQYLDLAGYPQRSALPPGFVRPAAQPLAPRVALPAPRPLASEPAPAPASMPSPAAEPGNPAGIRF